MRSHCEDSRTVLLISYGGKRGRGDSHPYKVPVGKGEPMGATQPLAGTRILILFPHLVVPGGALNYTLHLTELLLERDATVAILTLRAEPGQITLPPGV